MSVTDTPDFSFDLLATDGAARRGRVVTGRGPIDTPAFMPVGTAGTVKGMLPEQVAATGAQILLGNAYHLMLRPGAERVAEFGGLHRFMNWDGPILTDSGGYQVLSLTDLRKLDENGVTFRSHIDGSYWEMTPESSVEIQRLLDADITMVFDECPPYPCEEDEAKRSLDLTLRWAERSKAAFENRPGYGLFGIVQGGVHDHLREESARRLVEMGFHGYAVGGLAVGEPAAERNHTLEVTTPVLPTDRPRYLMGVGKPVDLVDAVERGIDMFDCVLPTRSGRRGLAFTWGGDLKLTNARFRDDHEPLDPNSSCPASRDYSKGYLHHLFRSGELLGWVLLTWHNLHFYQELMAAMRAAVEEGRFADFAAAFRERQAKPKQAGA
ncbi:tRNA guanosine(34) transglycosylase Tgt [Thiohalorhabdus denitrificans]|uniref:tRNA guanosine(34) transglycosylase Tgt n=1 Tax=Thiohalorhabdus denitrificans TaxID=381306 RepID=UPI0037DC097C